MPPSNLDRSHACVSMTKKKSKSDARRLASANGEPPSQQAAAELDLSEILPQFAFALRATLPLASYIPSTVLHILAVAYCIFVLPGRPASLTSGEVILSNLIQHTLGTLKLVIGGLIVVQLYFGGQAKRWWDAARAGSKAKEHVDSEAEAGGVRKKSVKEANEALIQKFDVSSRP